MSIQSVKRVLGIPLLDKNDDQLQQITMTFNRNLLDKNRTPDGLTHYFRVQRPIECIKYKLEGFYVPNSVYTVDSRNDSVTINYNGAGDTTVTLTHGLYDSPADLVTELQTKLQTINAGFTATLSTTTNKITITHSTNAFTYNIFGSSANEMLGIAFKQGKTAGDTIASAANSIVAQSVHTIPGSEYLHLQVDELSSGNQYGGLKGGVIAECVNRGAGNPSEYLNHTDNYIDLNGVQKINRLTVRILDDSGKTVPLNGIPPHFRITFVLSG